MNYRGVIIEESLENKNVLRNVQILESKVEQVTSNHKTPWVRQWTLHTVEIPEDMAESTAEKLSHSIDASHESSWYADYKNNHYHYIVFRNKIFKVDLKNPTLYKDARSYGISIIPEYQVDFRPEDKDWKR